MISWEGILTDNFDGIPIIPSALFAILFNSDQEGKGFYHIWVEILAEDFTHILGATVFHITCRLNFIDFRTGGLLEQEEDTFDFVCNHRHTNISTPPFNTLGLKIGELAFRITSHYCPHLEHEPTPDLEYFDQFIPDYVNTENFRESN